MSNAVDIGLTITQAMTGFEGAVNSTDPAKQIVNTAQMAASLSAFSNVAASSNTALGVAVANAGAALLTASKIQLDLSKNKTPSVDDFLSIAGNLIIIAGVAGIYLTVVSRQIHHFFNEEVRM